MLTVAGGLAIAVLLASVTGAPNIIVLVTDDQDLTLGSLSVMPTLNKLVTQRGMYFNNGFANTPVCCPSRSSMLTGKYTHNHGALNNTIPGNCSSMAWKEGPELDSIAVHMNASGYRSLYAGKYLNMYGLDKQNVSHIPPGWTEWFGLVGNSVYYNYTISDNGIAQIHGDNYTNDYLTDVLNRRACQFLNESVESHRISRENNEEQQPFFLWIGTPAAHAPFTPAPQYINTSEGEIAPRLPNYNQVFSDKHELLRNLQPMNSTEIAQSDQIYRWRHGTLQSVDDIIANIYNILEAANELDQTYFFFTADNGFHLGEFAMGYDKRQLYESDVRIPYIVAGPGIVAGSVANQPISHVDLAPTIIDIVTGAVPSTWDGMSFKNVLLNVTAPFREYLLLQYFGEGQNLELCGSLPDFYAVPCDQWNNTYSCLRTIASDGSQNDVFCEFVCFNDELGVAPCPPDQAEGYGEYYNLIYDPYQTRNTMLEITNPQWYQERLNTLKTCSGQSQCNINLTPSFV